MERQNAGPVSASVYVPARRRAAVAMLAGNASTVGITVAQAFLLVPLCLELLGPRLYGAWIAAAELLIWAQQLDAGLIHLVTQRVGAELGRGRLEEAARWSSTCLAILGGIAAALLITGWIATPLILIWLQVPEHAVPSFGGAFRLGLVASALLLAGSAVAGVSRGMQQPGVTSLTGVLGVLGGFLTSVALLFAGWGVWALAVGLVVRGVVGTVGSLVYLAGLPGPLTAWVARPSAAVGKEVWALTPPMATGSVASLLANNSEILLVTTFFGPVTALTYALTRRAMDGLRSLVESVGLAAAPGFAHLVAAGDRHRARGIVRELLWLRLAAACLGAAMVVSINEPFVVLLFGREHFGGVLLTSLFAGYLVVGGQSVLLNHLLRASGQIRESAWLRTAEAAARVVAMAGGLVLIGLSGPPTASLLVALGVAGVTSMRLRQALPGIATRGEQLSVKEVVVPLAVLLFGIVAAMLRPTPSFLTVSLVFLAIGTVGGLTLWWARPAGIWIRPLPRVSNSSS